MEILYFLIQWNPAIARPSGPVAFSRNSMVLLISILVQNKFKYIIVLGDSKIVVKKQFLLNLLLLYVVSTVLILSCTVQVILILSCAVNVTFLFCLCRCNNPGGPEHLWLSVCDKGNHLTNTNTKR
jgi:hypothetical protein